MKAILILSLIVNLALAGVLVATHKSKSPPAISTENPVAEAAPAKAHEVTAATELAVDVVTNTVVAPANAFDWRMVESGDYKKYIVNLRAIGCPEETIRDIIIADVNKLYANKLKELSGPKKKFEYWKPGGMMGAMLDTERMEKERALNKEKRALLTELLGSAPEEKADLLAGAATQMEAMFDFLPSDKRSKVFEAMQDMQVKMQKSMKGGTPDPDEIRKVMKESEATLAGILTPEELLEYQLRFSMTANMMRMQTAGFDPTEQEFLDIFKMRKAYDDEYGTAFGGSQTKAEKEKADAAKKELDAKIKDLLGEDRFTDYQRAQDWGFQQLNRIAEKNDLTTADAIKVYDMKKVAEDQAKKVRGDNSLDADQRKLALQGIRTETENSIKSVFGQKGFEAYQNQGGWWLKNISPDPK